MMKKILITLTAIATVVLASCTSSYGTATKANYSSGHHCSSCAYH